MLQLHLVENYPKLTLFIDLSKRFFRRCKYSKNNSEIDFRIRRSRRELWVEKYGAKRFSFRSIRDPIRGETLLSSTDAKFHEFANRYYPAFRVGAVITSVVHIERKHEEEKRSIEGRARENAVRDSATRRSRKCAFFFLARESNSWFFIF